MIGLGFLIKFSKDLIIYVNISHEINQFCSKHTLQEVYIDKFDSLDEDIAAALQTSVNHWAPGIESKIYLISHNITLT